MEKIYFDRKTNSKKPSTIRNRESSCPFCNREQLAGIVDECDDMIFVNNKFSTLENADMYVLIESNICESDMHTHSIDKVTTLLNFGINKWIDLESSGKYKSVAFFKNKGALSSGTIRHPHMQIIGFRDQNCMNSVKLENVLGHDVIIDDLAPFNLSDNPIVSFLEINIKLIDDIEKFARTVSFLANYMEEIYWGAEASYNFFFYNINGDRFLKIMPRYATSAITLGYDICQVYTEKQLEEYELMIKNSFETWKDKCKK